VQVNPDDGFRLFCFPYAGGNAAVYHGLRKAAGPHLAVCPVELPGRGRRRALALHTLMGPLVRELADDLEADLDRPFAFFGHSLGGLIAFELARELRERGAPEPSQLFLSAIAPPQTPRDRSPLHSAGDAEIGRRLRILGGTPQELLEDAQMMALTIPVLRADSSVLERYAYRPGPPLVQPLTVFGALDDPVAPPECLGGWRRHSVRGMRQRLYPGGHFYLHEAAADVMRSIEESLGLPEPPGQAGQDETSESGVMSMQPAGDITAGIGLLRIDHVGMAVANLDEAVDLYQRVFGMRCTHMEVNEEQGVREAMMQVGPDAGGSSLQLLAPLDPASMIARFLNKNGPGVQQVAYTVRDIEAACAELRSRGMRLLYNTPKRGTAGSRVNFLFPTDTGGVLVELVEPARAR
jgi:methylmalonyl-CoA epimerase